MEIEQYVKERDAALKKGDTALARKIFEDHIFHRIDERFTAKVQEQIKSGKVKQYDWLVVSAGTHVTYTAMIINALKPKNVYFIGTKEFKEHFLQKIVEVTKLVPSQYECDVINYAAMDLADVYQQIRNKLSLFAGKNVAVDLTRGRRIQCVGIGIIAAFSNFDLVYIDKSWDLDLNIPALCNEELVCVRNPFKVFGDLEEQYATTLYKNHDYASAEFIFKELCSKVNDPRDYEIKSLLSEAYALWEAFNYNGALRKLDAALQKIQQYNIRNISAEQIKHNINVLKTLQVMQSSKFDDVLSDEKFLLRLILDIYLNGERRAKQAKMEDAVARFYRTLELVSQHRLAKYGVITSNPNYSHLADLDKKYEEVTKQIYGEARAPPKNIGVRGEIGIKAGHIILYILNDDLWKGKTINDLKDFITMIRLRDHSIVAHGSELISSKSFSKIKKSARDFLMSIVEISKQNWSELLSEHQFIELELKTDKTRASASLFPKDESQ